MIASRLIWLYNLRLRLDVLKNSFVTRTTMTKPLSPATQAVMDAFLSEWDVYAVSEARWATAAALRAAADQVVPDGPKPSANSDFHLMNWTKSLDQYYQRQQTRAEILAIAAELESQ
jgi:hypothetical protein